ncbi:auxin-induced protein 6B [Cajanus cajan]|uniref:Auxin-induced protein 6B n=1 Tax=Cajanus cajan TaxID=3821 RepID=A0A151S035_CAJCA|nr:auxin-induced protein 6B [Cajanus cajan]KYP48097.1 Auxin-induced protein 6B [Cajanus cajan]
MFRYFVERMQKGLSLFGPRRPAFSYFSEDCATTDDVMEGYFVVLAIKGQETKRFIVSLEYLTDPAFLELLDEAREEYGFTQQGALALPCRPQELQKILDAPKAKSGEYQRRCKEYWSISACRSNY